MTFLFRSMVLFIFLACFMVCSCERSNNSLPSPDFNISPVFGDVETIFLFDANESLDEETEGWRLKARWDIDSDGNWDSEYSIEKRFACQFPSEGEHTITLEILDSYGGVSQMSKSFMVAPVLVDSSLIDPRDNQIYKTIRLYGKWWMAENLRYGHPLDPNSFPKDNNQVEIYRYTADSTKTYQYGVFYTWNEATYYQRDIVQGVCPDGWHIVNYEDFEYLSSLLLKINDKYAFTGIEGALHLELPLSGRYYYPSGDWDQQQNKGYFWINKELPFPGFYPWIYYNHRDTIIYRDDYRTVSWINHWRREWNEFTYKKIALPVRCVKD